MRGRRKGEEGYKSAMTSAEDVLTLSRLYNLFLGRQMKHILAVIKVL